MSQAGPSSNWAKLKQTLEKPSKSHGRIKGKKRAGEHGSNSHSGSYKRKQSIGSIGSYVNTMTSASSEAGPSGVSVPTSSSTHIHEDVMFLDVPAKDPRETALVIELREMVAGRTALNDSKRAPGKYVAIDCEMVGLGHQGAESALARVSIVNYHGHILLDTFVSPREIVTDLRTWVSGIKESDLLGAPSFEEVQKDVARIVEGKVLVGHAITNDLTAMLLNHPGPMIRDTQKCKLLRDRARTKYPGLKKLCAMELGIAIQKGSHSSVTDARATMALYRLHKVEWEKQLRPATEAYLIKTARSGKSHGSGPPVVTDGGANAEGSAEAEDDDDDVLFDGKTSSGATDAVSSPGGGKGRKRRRGSIGNGNVPERPGPRKGMSSGLGKIVKVNGVRVVGRGEKRARMADGLNGSRAASGRAQTMGHDRSAAGANGGGGNWWESSAV